MDQPGEKVNIEHLLTAELGVSLEHIPDKPRHLIEFNRNAEDGDSSVPEEDLQETEKKLTDTLRTNNESKYVDEFVNLFMTNDKANEPQP